MEQTCPNCGADNLASARYCRKCGVQIGSSQFTEAPTRSFEEQRQPGVDHMSSSGGPGYAEPPRYTPPSPVQQPTGYQPHTGVTGVPQRINTSPITTGPMPRKGPNWLLIIGAIFLTMVIAGGALLAFVISRIKVNSGTGDTPTPVAAKKDDKSIGFTFGAVSDPDKLPKSLRGWYYDGAEIQVVTSGQIAGAEGGVMVLKSDDDISDIADFYRERFKDFKTKREVKDQDHVIFSGDGANVVLTPDEENEGITQIVVQLGGENGIPGIPDVMPIVPPIPPPPGVPAPPAPGASDGKAPSATPDATPKPNSKDAKAPKAEVKQTP